MSNIYIFTLIPILGLLLLVVQSLSPVQLFAIPWTAAQQTSLSFTMSCSLLKLMSNESMMPSNHLNLHRPFLLLPSIFASMSLFHWVGCLHHVAKVLELRLQHQSFQWIFRVDFLYIWLVGASCCPGDSQESSPSILYDVLCI